jgi:hypothetical protein
MDSVGLLIFFAIAGAFVCAKARVAAGAVVFSLVALVLFVTTPVGAGLPGAASGPSAGTPTSPVVRRDRAAGHAEPEPHGRSGAEGHGASTRADRGPVRVDLPLLPGRLGARPQRSGPAVGRRDRLPAVWRLDVVRRDHRTRARGSAGSGRR